MASSEPSGVQCQSRGAQADGSPFASHLQSTVDAPFLPGAIGSPSASKYHHLALLWRRRLQIAAEEVKRYKDSLSSPIPNN